MILLLCLGTAGFTHAQQVKIRGRVYHPQDPSFNLLIVNKRTTVGMFGNKDGTFEINVEKTDTLLIGALGYNTEKVCMADSVLKPIYNVKLYVRPLAYNLKEFRVLPQRALDSIQKDIRALGYNENDYKLSGIDAVQSPLTFLYQQVSRKERQKRRAYQVINEERRRELLKELFAQYVSYEIIDLQQSEFDDFVDFMNVSEEGLKSMSQYDFIIYTKERYRQFRKQPPRLRQDIDMHD